MPSKIKIATTATKVIVGFCAGATTKRVLKNNVEPENKRQEIETYVGSAVIGGVVAEAAEQHIENLFNEIAEFWQQIKNTVNPN